MNRVEMDLAFLVGIGLAAIAVWHLFRPFKNLGRDVAVFHEDETDDLEELYRPPAADRDGAE